MLNPWLKAKAWVSLRTRYRTREEKLNLLESIFTIIPVEIALRRESRIEVDSYSQNLYLEV